MLLNRRLRSPDAWAPVRPAASAPPPGGAARRSAPADRRRRGRRARATAATIILLLAAAGARAGVLGPGPNAVTIPSTGQELSAAITAPADGATVPMPPGTALLEGSCAVGSVAGQTINVVYVLDVSGSTDLDYLVQNHRPLVDADGSGTAGDAGDDLNGDGEAGDVLDGEIAGVLALHASIGDRAQVNVGVVAFASEASAADVDPELPNSGGIQQVFTTPPQVDRDALGGPDVPQVLRSLDSDFTNPAGGQIKLFTPVPRANLGTSTDFVAALATANAALAQFPAGTNVVFMLSDGESNQGRCFEGACATQLAALVAAGTVVHTVGVSTAADPVDLQFIADATEGTYTQVTDPSDLVTVLPTIIPVGLARAEVDGEEVVLDALGSFTHAIVCAGEQPFTVTATCIADDLDATMVSADVTLTCGVLCGNGTIDAGAGEECDPPDGVTCAADCQRVAQCGDGFLDAPEECEPPGGETCDASCRAIACGNGLVQAGEECEPPDTATCDGACQRVPVCGDGHVDAPETCDPPDGADCGATCGPIVCGDGVPEGAEECDPPDGETCDAGCTTFGCPDPDEDGACAGVDNCPGVPNPEQTDADGDGIGDACDPCTDTDGDGFGDPGFAATTCALDVCPEIADPAQADLDGDGEGDLCDGEDGALRIVSAKLKRSKDPAEPNGTIVVKGDFVVPLPEGGAIEDVFNADLGISARIRDGALADETSDWAAPACETVLNKKGRLRRIRCQSADGGTKAIFKPVRKSPGTLKFTIKARKRALGPAFAGPVTLVVTSAEVVDRVGQIASCQTNKSGLKCRAS